MKKAVVSLLACSGKATVDLVQGYNGSYQLLLRLVEATGLKQQVPGALQSPLRTPSSRYVLSPGGSAPSVGPALRPV